MNDSMLVHNRLQWFDKCPRRSWRLWVRRGFLLPVYAYRYVLSPLLPPACRYYPTCSAYAIEAVMRHGIVRGLWLTVCRLARCHPWAAGGVDPVPLRKAVPNSTLRLTCNKTKI